MLERATLGFTLIVGGLAIIILGITGRTGVALGALLCPSELQIVGGD